MLIRRRSNNRFAGTLVPLSWFLIVVRDDFSIIAAISVVLDQTRTKSQVECTVLNQWLLLRCDGVTRVTVHVHFRGFYVVESCFYTSILPDLIYI